MLLLDVASTCSSASLALVISAVKKIILIIQIIVPILLIVGASLGIYQMVSDPERKNGLKNIINKFIAAAMVFFIPVFVNLVMGLVGESTNFSSCWNSVKYNGTISTTYVDPSGNTSRSGFISNSSDYEKGKKKITSNNSNNSSTSNHATANTAVAPVNSNSSNANKTIFVGDSRTVQMYAHLTGKWSGANYSSGGVHVVDNDVFIAQGAQGLDWLQSTGVPEATKYFGSGSALVILMGVNDVRNIDKYISYLNNNVSRWTSTGTKVYYSSITPCDGNYDSMNSKINSFNSKLSSNLPSGITWIDTNAYLMNSGFTTTDGLHYNKNTSIKIYNYIKSKV